MNPGTYNQLNEPTRAQLEREGGTHIDKRIPDRMVTRGGAPHGFTRSDGSLELYPRSLRHRVDAFRAAVRKADLSDAALVGLLDYMVQELSEDRKERGAATE